MVDVTARLCGLHAQVMSSAELTLWARVDDLQPGAVADALWKQRTLVKTWAMRGTLHLLPAAELPIWQAALSRYRHYQRPVWLRAFGITRDEQERLLGAVAEALDGEMLTREELAAAVAARTGSAELGQKVLGSWGAMLKPASYRGQLCFAPSVGQKVRFTRPDRWLGVGPPADPGQAALEVTRRYLSVNGPATREDCARWWGLTPAEAGRLIAGLADDVTAVDLAGTVAWMLTGHVADALGAAPLRSVRLLPAFDQYVVAASGHAERLLPGPFRSRVYRPQGWLTPVLAVGGRMDGLWRHGRKAGRVRVEIEPLTALPRWASRAAEEEAARLAAFLGGPLDLHIGASP
jgi:hypothetical protein